MSGPFKRRPSLRKSSLRKPSLIPSLLPLTEHKEEVPWDLVDRCLFPVLFCHGISIILSTFLNGLGIAELSSITLFFFLTITVIGFLLIYHNLKISAAGKAVLITGCDSKLGTLLARQLDELGFTVFAAYQSCYDNLDAQLLKNHASGRVHVMQLDVSSEEQIISASLYIVAHLPDGASGLWAVINAASWVTLGEIEWVPSSVIRKAADINLLGVTRVVQVMLPLVRRSKGRIINVTSALARVASPVRGIHCAMLAGVEALSICLKQELKPRGVDVIIVAPGELSIGNAWLSDEQIVKQAKQMWAEMGFDQKKEYGEEYFENAIRSLEKFTKGEPDYGAVIKALTDSVIRTFPLSRYTPVTCQEKIQIFVSDHFPKSFYDLCYS